MKAAAPVARLEAMEIYWAPFTPNRDFRAEPKIFVRAEGMYYWSDRGDRILDASSGLFCSAAILAPAFVAEKAHIDQMAETVRSVLRTL